MVGVVNVKGLVLRLCVGAWSWVVRGVTERMSLSSLPFLMVLFEYGNLVIKVDSGEGLRGGVTGGTGASGKRGRRCPRPR